MAILLEVWRNTGGSVPYGDCADFFRYPYRKTIGKSSPLSQSFFVTGEFFIQSVHESPRIMCVGVFYFAGTISCQ